MSSDAAAPNPAKLIVNYLPQKMKDEQFTTLFATCGALKSTKVMRDRATGYSYGYGFVEYENAEDAQTAINKLNGHKLGEKTLKVALSKPKSAKNVNLYLSGLGPQTTEDRVQELFSAYGDVIQVKILKDKDTGCSKETGFVLFGNKAEADDAIKNLQGYADGFGMNLQIKYAKDSSEQQRTHPMFQQYLAENPQAQAAIMGGGLGGYGTGPNMGNRSFAMQGMQQPYGYNAGYSGGMGAAMGRGMGMGMGMNPYQQIGGFNGGQMGALGSGYGGGYSNGAAGPKAARGRGTARFNPMGRPGGAGMMGEGTSSVVYVYNIGPDAEEKDMYMLFSKFGRIEKVDVMTGKGFAFVHMMSQEEAASAIDALNGTYFNGKNLQVSFKTSKK